jgi:hypothetical protein
VIKPALVLADVLVVALEVAVLMISRVMSGVPYSVISDEVRTKWDHHAAYTKGNFQFERTVAGWQERYTLLDLRRK